MLLARFGLNAQALEQQHVLVGLRVAGGQQFFAVEDRVGTGEEGQGLHLLVHLLATGRQPYVGFRHHDPRHGEHTDEVEGIDILLVGQRRTLHFNQHVDRYRLRMLGQVGQLDQQAGAVVQRLTHAEDATGANLHA